MALEIEGTLHKKFDEQNINATFKKREFVVETDEKYPQLIKFELVQERCSLIDEFSTGDKLKVEFNLKGREWNEKYFTNLHAWRISKVGPAAEQGGGNFPPAEEPPVSNDEAYLDDLPF
ncbi:MAG: DUF3127 domain-containing protein [Aureispira sp.]|nr:DUF3127 domain-containing protein [Aureispira sp.]